MSLLDEPITCPEEVASYDAAENRDQFRVVAIGESVTQCARQDKGDRWPDLLQTLIGDRCRVVNAGIGGTSSNLGLYRWSRDVAPVQPHCVVFCFLLNDSHIRFYECRSSYVVQCTPDRMEANLRTLAQLTRSIGASPVFWTPPPVPRYVESYKSEIHLELQMSLLEQYHAIVRRVATDLAIPLADLWTTFPQQVDEYPGPYFDAPDGYHSNHASQPVLARNIAEQVSPLYEMWARQKDAS